MRTKNIVYTAVLTAFICVTAPLSIPIGAVPISLATLSVGVVAAVGGTRRGIISVALYIILGASGVPVFSGFSGGVAILTGATGGFIIGYIPYAAVVGLITGKAQSGKRFANYLYPAAFSAGTALCYICGTAWFMLYTDCSFAKALSACVIPFIIPDIAKITLASFATPIIRKNTEKRL